MNEPPLHPRMGWDVRLHTYNSAILLLGTYLRQMKNIRLHKDVKANVPIALFITAKKSGKKSKFLSTGERTNVVYT